ncbi:hypothetical protein BC830DRAFT_510427 [Chytriomyces sp. MP71]|nr:hypothetical protein BC830DRAFT_510427 [Chytriomyces sp. MP71]
MTFSSLFPRTSWNGFNFLRYLLRVCIGFRRKNCWLGGWTYQIWLTAQKDSYQTLSKDKTARAPNPLEGPVTEDSIVLSGCSDLTTFFKSHQVIRMGHRLMDEQSLKYRARKIGLDGILNESDTKSISKSIKSTLRAKAQMKIAQIDRELYNMALSKILEELLGSNEVSIGHLPLEIFQETAIKSLHSFGVIPWTADEGDTPTENEAEAYRFRKAAAESFMKVRATTYGIFVPKQYSEILGAQIVKLLKVRHHTGLLPNEFDILLLGFVEEWKLWDDSMAEELKRKKKQLENGEKDGHWHRMKWAPKDSDFVRQIVSVRARQVKILLDKTQVRMVVKRLFREDHIATILSNDRALALIIIETVIRDRVTSMNVKKSIEETAFRQVANQLIDSKDLDILLQDFDSLLQHLDLTKRK